MIKKSLVSTGVLGFIPMVYATSPSQEHKSSANAFLIRPSDLPLYDDSEFVKIESVTSKNDSYLQSLILPTVKSVRQQIQVVWDQTESVKNAIQDNYHQVQDKSDWIFKYLREEENKDIRYGAVVMGGITGFIFGLRGGIIRRLLYGGVGSTAMGFVCFPEETKEFASTNGALAKQYINIAYNFLYGVKPGDPQLEIKFPELKFPKNFSELVDQSASLAATVKQAVMPPPSKDAADSKPLEKNQ